MTMQLYFYADAESVDRLVSETHKMLLIGSDFGYGNFGDVLQHKGAAAYGRQCTNMEVVSVFALNALSRQFNAVRMREGYGVDALMYVSEQKLSLRQADTLGLVQVKRACNIACIQLYGGGFLNENWGDFVLGVTEWFLARLPGATYVVSGQQVSPGYMDRVVQHVHAFKPSLFGARDSESREGLLGAGVDAYFSFDDAVEQLQLIGHEFGLRRGEGAFIHLNSSGYTGNAESLGEMVRHLHEVESRCGKAKGLTLLQAFQDAREEVVDTIETIKRFELGFPFVESKVVLLLAAIMNAGTAPQGARLSPLEGGFGYSCSYHVALWLQLHGIPCWLRGSNSYYDQKRNALGVVGTFEEFLEAMPIPDHSASMHARERWLQTLGVALSNVGRARNMIEFPCGGNAPVLDSFDYKGEPRFEEKLHELWASMTEFTSNKDVEITGKDSEIAAKDSEIAAKDSEIAIRDAGLAEKNAEILRLVQDGSEQKKVLESRLLAQSEILRQREAELLGRIQGYSTQLTELGVEARDLRAQSEWAYASFQEADARRSELNRRLQQIEASRSWRVTRPLRALNRFRVTRRFDASGEVGLFEAIRLLGYKLHVPPKARRYIGGIATKFRRR